MIIASVLYFGMLCNQPTPKPFNPLRHNPIHVNCFSWRREDKNERRGI